MNLILQEPTCHLLTLTPSRREDHMMVSNNTLTAQYHGTGRKAGYKTSA
jgi:hypothetical protein